MNIWQIIFACIMGIPAVVSFIIAYAQSKEKGFVFSNAWIFSSEKERERRKINKKLEYRLAKNIFICLGVLFLLIALHILTLWSWLFLPIGAVIIFVAVYAVVQSAKNGHFK